MKLNGVLLHGAYRLRRHRWLGGSLALWLGVLFVAGGTLTIFRSWLPLWPVVPWAVLLLGLVAFMVWAARRQYIHFEAMPQAESSLQSGAPVPPLRANQDLPIRASGWFTVEERGQYFVDLEADYKTTVSREHIILGRVHPSRFLLFGSWPKGELGWWYIFCQPAAIRRVEVGTLQIGSCSQLALRVIHSAGENVLQALYLTAEDASTLLRVWQDLMQDAAVDKGAANVAAG